MIRDKNKIYGEPNDPNTVLASGILANDSFVVGAGNKGIKTFSAPNKSLLTTDATGKATPFPFGTANKVIATDGSGNLILRDIVIPTVVFTFGGDNNQATAFSNVNMGVGATLFNYQGLGGCKSTLDVGAFTGRSCGLVTYQKSLVIPTGGKTVNYAFSYAGIGDDRVTLSFVNTGGTNYTVFTGQVSAQARGGITLVGQTALPAGTYNRLNVQPTGGVKLVVGATSMVGATVWYQ